MFFLSGDAVKNRILFTCRMLESSYNLLFGKLALKCLFEEYFDEARHFSTVIMLKPIDDPHVDLVATVSLGSYTIIHKLVIIAKFQKLNI